METVPDVAVGGVWISGVSTINMGCVVNVVVVWISSVGIGVDLGVSITLAKMMRISISHVWGGVSGQSSVCTINTSVVNVVGTINTSFVNVVVIWVYSSIGVGVILGIGISFGFTFASPGGTQAGADLAHSNAINFIPQFDTIPNNKKGCA